ncbi:MAG: DUF4358 domain-containing protein [Clostridia bacterium]|nr:DUF4358 domain-containing protein [Clostridia bacterium]
MQKKFLLILLGICMLALGACAKPALETTTQDAGLLFTNAYTAMEPQLPEMMEIPEDMILDYYGIEPADYTASLVRISVDNMLADEIVLMEGVDDAAADRIEAMLNERLQAKADEAESYSPEQFAIIEKCAVVRDGQSVALLVSADHQSMADAFMARS